jgi:hypothetical protein
MEEITRQEVKEVLEQSLRMASIPYTEEQLERMVGGYFPPMPKERLEFGDWCNIEQKRYGVPNELWRYKVVGGLNTNHWVDVPVQSPATETRHETMEDVVEVLIDGIHDSRILRFRRCDVKECKIAGK